MIKFLTEFDYTRLNMSNYLSTLNEKQLQAVTSNEKYIRVVAGAGSGKTKVLTSRISYLVENGIEPSEILAITFTNKASKEMKERVLKNIDNLLGSPFISTFHSFCVRFLREEINELGYPKDFNIIDEEDKTKLVKEILKDKNIDKNYLNHKTIINYISYYKTYYYIRLHPCRKCRYNNWKWYYSGCIFVRICQKVIQKY